MAKPYKEGKGWCVRKRYAGKDIYLSGHTSKAKVEKALRAEMEAIDKLGAVKGRGPRGNTLAQALQDFALEQLPRLKGAPQELRRINKYLDAAELNLLVLVPATGDSGLHFEVKLTAPDTYRRIPNGLGPYRKALLCKTAGSDDLRRVLAQKAVADINRNDIQRFMDALRGDGLAPATLALERALLRGFFNYVRKNWAWAQPADNPAKELKLPAVKNGRTRVLSAEEQILLDAAFDDMRGETHRNVVTLLRETAMRASEPLLHAKWGQVDWEKCILTLDDSKNGKRDVPLSAIAIDALKALGPGGSDEPIVSLTYEALKASTRRALERAGIKNFRLQDLRHTAATRMALETGNIFLVKALTGHKTLDMVERYVNVAASDVVEVMRRRKDASIVSKGPVAIEVVAKEVAAPPAAFDAAQMQDIVSRAVAQALAAVAAGAGAHQLSGLVMEASNTPSVRSAA